MHVMMTINITMFSPPFCGPTASHSARSVMFNANINRSKLTPPYPEGNWNWQQVD